MGSSVENVGAFITSGLAIPTHADHRGATRNVNALDFVGPFIRLRHAIPCFTPLRFFIRCYLRSLRGSAEGFRRSNVRREEKAAAG